MNLAELTNAGYVLDRDAHQRLDAYLNLLLEENARCNLTAIRSRERAWVLHICDSLALLERIDAAGAQNMIDLGSGGGVPGIPLACARPGLRMTLIDATRKKVDAMTRIIERLGLENVRAVWGRAEALAHEPGYREQFDAVAARAVAKLPLLLEYACGFVRPGGACWFFESTRTASAAPETVASVAEKCALCFERTHEYTLPHGHGRRAILEYRKRTRLVESLPRPPDRAKGRPLG